MKDLKGLWKNFPDLWNELNEMDKQTWRTFRADYSVEELTARFELEEQLEDMTLCRDIASGHRKEVQDRETILLNQQKEFIKYLEDMLDDENDIFSVVRVKDVLQKYKSIIGVSDDKTN